MVITNEIIEKAVDQVRRHMVGYSKEIDETYVEDGDIDVALKVSFSGEGGGVRIATQIAFSLGKIKDKWAEVVGQEQMGLPVQ